MQVADRYSTEFDKAIINQGVWEEKRLLTMLADCSKVIGLLCSQLYVLIYSRTTNGAL